MANGTYKDQISGETFTVSGGRLTGKITNKNGIAVVYNPSVDYGTVNPEKPTVIKISAAASDGSNVFYTDSVSVKMNVEGASSAKYTTSEGKSGIFTGSSATVSVGSYTATGEDVGITITAIAKDGTKKEKTYTFTKKIISSEYPTLTKGGVVFDNSSYNWSDVYCYAYTGNGAVKNAAWPGVKMTPEQGDYYSYVFPSTLTGTVSVIFNNGSGIQYPGSGKPGLEMKNTDKKLFQTDVLTNLPESVPTLKVSLKASQQKVSVNQKLTLTASASDNSGTVKYTFLSNDGTTLRSAGTSNTCTWTPAKAGSYIIAVKASDSSNSVTAVTNVEVVGESSELVSTSSIKKSGNTITLNGSAAGGKAPYQYTYCYKSASSSTWTCLKAYSTVSTLSFNPSKADTYNICIKVKDSNSNVAKSYFKATITTSVLANSVSISPKTIAKGDSVNVKSSASGGAGSYEYAVFYKKSTQSSWTTAQKFRTNSTVSITPKSTGTYNICVKAKDKAGTIVKSYHDITVTVPPLSNSVTLSASSIKLGSSVTVKSLASGGTGSYEYAVFYKKSTQSSWTTAQKFRTNSMVSITPKSTGTYNICVKAKDSSGTIVKIYQNIIVGK